MGCEPGVNTDTAAASGLPAGGSKADDPSSSSLLPAGFPEEQDLAILIPMDAEPALQAGYPTQDGDVLLSETWLQQVSDAYLDTDVADALEVENWYGDWRVVSVRIAPCGPLGHFPGHLPGGFCWPQVRIVWQPVLENHALYGFIHVDRYADDRAIHALYRVQPYWDATQLSSALETVLEHINSGLPMEDLDAAILQDLEDERNLAMNRLISDVADLRVLAADDASWSGVDVRNEYYQGDEIASEFHERLYDFLWSYAQPWALHELTSFSLPEGQSPASIDSWVFIAFDGYEGEITQKDLTVRSRTTGEILVNIGSHQTVSTAGEDQAVLDALTDPAVAEELAQQVLVGDSNIDVLGAMIADPTQTFVSNTTCASCHRLQDPLFDFHTFSYFEDRSATISPRVVEDVDNDLRVLRGFLEGTAP
tara:strand:+ start:1392 stop:2660 length:1269 start_codon:yes stop_codon:yes gene_type:complete